MHHGGVPIRAFGRFGAVGQKIEGLVVGGNETRARTGLNRHIAQGHPPFHAQRLDGRTGIFQHAARAARRADFADNRKRDVLGGDMGRRDSGHDDAKIFRFALNECLRRQHMLDLRRADACRQRAERAMRGSVAVAADDGEAGQGKALFRPDDMHDALPQIVHGQIFNAEFGAIGLQRLNLQTAFGVVDGGQPATPVAGRDIVVGYSQRLVRRAHLPPRHAQTLEGLRAGHLMHQMAVDIKKAVIGRIAADKVGVPDFVVKGGGRHRGIAQLSAAVSSGFGADATLPRRSAMRAALPVRPRR